MNKDTSANPKNGNEREADQAINFDLLIKEEIERIEVERTTWLQSAEVQDSNELIQEILDKAIPALETAESQSLGGSNNVCEALASLIKRSQLSYYEGEGIFYMLYMLLFMKTESLKKSGELTDAQIQRRNHTLFYLRSTAFVYCRKELEEEVNKHNLPDAVVYIKRLYRQTDEEMKNGIKRPFLLKAAKNVLKTVEDAITLAKEGLELTSQLGIAKPTAVDMPAEEAETEENNSLQYKFNLAHKVHAILYLLKGTGVNTNAQGLQAEIARFIRAITGQNYKNIYNLVLADGFDPKKENEKHKEELRKVRDKFVKLKSSVEKSIQNDLERKRY